VAHAGHRDRASPPVAALTGQAEHAQQPQRVRELGAHVLVGFAATVGIDKYPCEWYSRPALWPVWNHCIRGPVRFWSLAGPDEPILDALGERRLGDLHRLIPSAAEEAEQLQEELAASLGHLQRVDAAYWEREWRRDHKGLGIYPEDHLWRATHGYLDLLAATRAAGAT
jgi:hypothetical protein